MKGADFFVILHAEIILIYEKRWFYSEFGCLLLCHDCWGEDDVYSDV